MFKVTRSCSQSWELTMKSQGHKGPITLPFTPMVQLEWTRKLTLWVKLEYNLTTSTHRCDLLIPTSFCSSTENQVLEHGLRWNKKHQTKRKNTIKKYHPESSDRWVCATELLTTCPPEGGDSGSLQHPVNTPESGPQRVDLTFTCARVASGHVTKTPSNDLRCVFVVQVIEWTQVTWFYWYNGGAVCGCLSLSVCQTVGLASLIPL